MDSTEHSCEAVLQNSAFTNNSILDTITRSSYLAGCSQLETSLCAVEPPLLFLNTAHYTSSQSPHHNYTFLHFLHCQFESMSSFGGKRRDGNLDRMFKKKKSDSSIHRRKKNIWQICRLSKQSSVSSVSKTTVLCITTTKMSMASPKLQFIYFTNTVQKSKLQCCQASPPIISLEVTWGYVPSDKIEFFWGETTKTRRFKATSRLPSVTSVSAQDKNFFGKHQMSISP